MKVTKFDVFTRLLQVIQAIAFVYAMVILVLWFRNGHHWFYRTILPLHRSAFTVLLELMFLVLIPLAVVRPTRPYTSLAFYQLTYILGGIAWFNAAYYCLNFLHPFWFVFGLFMAGIGVVPVAVIGSIIKGHWSYFWPIALQLLATIACRMLSSYAGSASGKFLK